MFNEGRDYYFKDVLGLEPLVLRRSGAKGEASGGTADADRVATGVSAGAPGGSAAAPGVVFSQSSGVSQVVETKSQLAKVLVYVPSEMSQAERALIQKILGAIQLGSLELNEISLISKESVLALPATNILSFVVDESFKTSEVLNLGDKKWWRFCSASMMLTENEVLNVERKKQVWALLQRLKSEL